MFSGGSEKSDVRATVVSYSHNVNIQIIHTRSAEPSATCASDGDGGRQV
jgi:hypothetical protein